MKGFAPSKTQKEIDTFWKGRQQMKNVNPLRKICNDWIYAGKGNLVISVDAHSSEPTTVMGTSLQQINPYGFTCAESEFEIPWHRVLTINNLIDGECHVLYTKIQVS